MKASTGIASITLALLPLMGTSRAAVASRPFTRTMTGFLPPALSKPMSYGKMASSRCYAVPPQSRDDVAKEVENNIDETVTFVERASKALSKDIRVPRFLSPRRPNDLSTDLNSPSSTVKAWFVLATSLSFAFGNGLFFALSYVYLYFSRPADLPDITAAIAAGLTAAVLTPILTGLSHLLLLDNLDMVTISGFRGVVGVTVAVLAAREALKEADAQGFIDFKEIVPPMDSDASALENAKASSSQQRPKITIPTAVGTTTTTNSRNSRDAGKGR